MKERSGSFPVLVCVSRGRSPGPALCLPRPGTRRLAGGGAEARLPHAASDSMSPSSRRWKSFFFLSSVPIFMIVPLLYSYSIFFFFFFVIRRKAIFSCGVLADSRRRPSSGGGVGAPRPAPACAPGDRAAAAESPASSGSCSLHFLTQNCSLHVVGSPKSNVSGSHRRRETVPFVMWSPQTCFESDGSLFVNEISCVTPRHCRERELL